MFLFLFLFFRQKLLIILRAETTIFNHCSDSCIYNLNPVLILGIGIEEPLAVSPGHTEMSGKLSMERLKVSEAWAGLAAHPFWWVLWEPIGNTHITQHAEFSYVRGRFGRYSFTFSSSGPSFSHFSPRIHGFRGEELWYLLFMCVYFSFLS